jgi:hypothetical protein
MAFNFKGASETPTSNVSPNWFRSENTLSEPLKTRSQFAKKKLNYFWLRKDETRKIVILDSQPSVRVAFHTDSANNYEKVICLAQHGPCPICDVAGHNLRFSRSRDYVIVSILDLTSWTTKDGRVVPYTKRLWAVETESQRNVLKKYLDKYGTTRGLVLDMNRSGQKGEGSSGTPMFDDFLTEEVIRQNFHNEEYVNPEGKVLKVAGQDMQPHDYAKILVMPTASEMRSSYNLASPLGAKESFEPKDDGVSEEDLKLSPAIDFDPSDYEDDSLDMPF